MGPIQDNFISWKQIRMLMIEQPDKLLRDLKTVKATDSFAFIPQPTLLAEPTITRRLVISLLNAALNGSTFINLVLYNLWLCSIILKPTLHFYLKSGHLNGT